MPKRLLPEERLDILREMGGERKWYSLDDKRVCAVCDRVFTGRQIEIECNSPGHFQLHCPTPGCPAGMRHWFLCELSPARFTQPKPRKVEVTFLTPEFGNG